MTNRNLFDSVKVGYAMLYTVKELFPNDVSFTTYLKTLSGVDYVYSQNYSLNELFEILDNDKTEFLKIREKYLLY